MKVGHTAQDEYPHVALIMAKLNHQRTQVHFCDCVIRKGQGQVYPVHRCILAASSPVLASILCSSGVLVELETPCLSDSILGLLLDYIYTGTLPHLDSNQYSYLFTAAQYLEMAELQNTLRTKRVRALGYYNTCDVATQLTLIPSRMDYSKSPSDCLHPGCTSEPENPQKDIHWRPLSLDAGSKYLTLSDGVCMKTKTDPSSDYAQFKTSKLTVHDSGFSDTTETSRKLIESIRSCGETPQMSTMCQNIENNDALKPDIWQERQERETKSYSTDSTKTQEHEKNQDEKTHGFCLQGNVKAEEINLISEVQSRNSCCSSTSVIRHSSRVSGKHEGTASTKVCHDTEAYTGKKSLPQKSHCNIVEDTKTHNQHLDNQDLEQSALPDHPYSVRSFNLIQNNELMDNKSPFEKDSNGNEKYNLDPKSRKFSQIHDTMPRVTTINTAIYSKDENDAAALAEQISATMFQDKRTCTKRKLIEEQSDKCNKSAKTDLVYSAETGANKGSLCDREQDTTCKDKNTLDTALYRSLSVPSEGNTFQFQCTSSLPSYSGHLFYHCESQIDGSSNPMPFAICDFSPTFSDKPSQDNDVSIFSNLSYENATLSERQVVLLDISSKSSEMMVSYKQTSEMGNHVAHNLGKVKADNESQNSDEDNQEVNDGHRALCHEGTKMTTTMTSCTSVCGKDCVHNSVSTSVSDHIPLSGMQTDISGRPSSPVQHAFQCSLCERSFSQRGSLNRHMRSHLGVRPFPCPHCPMTFSRQYRVIEHMRVHQRSALGMDFPKPPASSV